MNNSFKIALVQMNSTDNVKQNLISIEDAVKKASKNAQLIIFPEHSDGIGKVDNDFAHCVPGEITDFFSSLAKEYKVYIHCGSITKKSSTQKPYNTTVLFAPSGEMVAEYSKLHMFDIDLPDGTGCRESATITRGDSIVVADTDFCKIGLSICYDLRFPELYRTMALNGAKVLIVSADFTAPTGEFHWKPLLQARAIENGCYVLAVNQCGDKPQFKAYGHTMIIDPWGRVLGELNDEPDILFGEIDLDLVEDVRTKIPSLNNRRTDLY